MNIKFIGLSGKLGSGKTTLAKYFKQECYPDAIIMSFSTELKKFASIITDTPLHQFMTHEGKSALNEVFSTTPITDLKLFLTKLYNESNGQLLHYAYGCKPLVKTNWQGKITNGEVLQFLGEFMRGLDVDIWVNSLMTQVSMNTLIIIDDVRYMNEINAIRIHNGIVVRIVRDLIQREDGRNKRHRSEIELDKHPFKYSIDNSGLITLTLKQLDKIINPFLET
jgi:hypothetical protein